MINTELKNIIFSASLDVSENVNRFYYNIAPQKKNKTVFPYVTYYLGNQTFDKRNNGYKTGEIKLQFNVFEDNTPDDYGAQCNDILDEIHNYFDNDFLSFANTSGSVEIISCLNTYDKPATYNGEVWQATTIYKLRIHN